MARIFDSTAPDYVRATTSPVTTLPLTVSCWAKMDSIPSTNETIMYYADSSSATVYFHISMLTTGAYQIFPRWTGASSKHISSTGKADGTWHHIMQRSWYDVPATTYRHEAWLDGVLISQFDTGNAGILTNFDRVTAGYLDRPVPTQPLNGSVAEIAIASMQGEIRHAVALANGISPHRVFGTNLKFYAPLWGLDSPEPELSGSGNDMTLFGSPSQANHAPVGPYTPKWSASFPFIETGGAATRRIYLDDALISIPA